MLFDSLPEFGPSPDELDEQFNIPGKFDEHSMGHVLGQLAWRQSRQRAEIFLQLHALGLTKAQTLLVMSAFEGMQDETDDFVRKGLGVAENEAYDPHPLEDTLDSTLEGVMSAFEAGMTEGESARFVLEDLRMLDLAEMSDGDLICLLQSTTWDESKGLA